MKSDGGSLVLGLDLGPNSLGWALLREDDGEAALEACGVRAFEEGLEGLEQDGRGQSPNVDRRQARSRRRLAKRRARRLKVLFARLQRAGLLPTGQREDVIAELDRALLAEWEERLRAEGWDETRLELLPHNLPYVLRARALDEKLSPHALGRALYHLGQRRGFLSNRKAPPKKDEDQGVIKKEIADLERRIAESGARTLGEFLSRIDPAETRIRKRHTARRMYEDEFHKIWAAQAPHHPGLLTDALKERIHKAIFHQRPLKSTKNLVGLCEYEPGRRRAPFAILEAQRFRLIQRVDQLEVTFTDTGEVRPLAPEERRKLIDALDTKGDLTFGRVRKLLGLRNCYFNLEKGGEKKMPGNRTAQRIAKVIGEERWRSLSDEERLQLVEDLRSIEKEETLVSRAQRRWDLDEETARRLAAVELEKNYCHLSRQALAKLLPLMENGTPYMTAVMQVYGERYTETVDLLPPVNRAFPFLRNPLVTRALTELRKVVNALIRKYGKPDTIRIELARQLKQSADRRQKTWQRNRRNQRAREDAKRRILEELHIQEPSRRDIQKVLLADECDWTCPYTGVHFGMRELLGPHPQVDIEHIIPFKRSLDDSFLNKTLCLVEENRRKRDRTPFEAYGHDPQRWDAIIERVKRFKSDLAHEKLRRFLLRGRDLDEFLARFTNRQLNDTAWASRLATRYLGLLFGCREDQPGVDAEGNRRIFTTSGQATAYLRNEWYLNAVLGGGPEKSREDHRHHAIDAIVIALTTPATIKQLSDAAQRAESARRRRFASIPRPWPDFFENVQQAVLPIVVSHRVSKKVNGPLHQETYYSPPRQWKDENGRTVVGHVVRKPLDKLSKREIERIVDPVVRSRVKAKLEELKNQLGTDNPAKAFAQPENHPCMETRDGRRIPIHKARIRIAMQALPVARERPQYVAPASNHHVEILETTDKKGRTKWEGVVVTRMEAMRRLRQGKPIIQRNHGPNKRFLFSLTQGETIEIDDEEGRGRQLYRVRGIGRLRQSGREYIQITAVRLNDARILKDIPNEDKCRKIIDPLRKLHCRKVVVDLLGGVHPAND